MHSKVILPEHLKSILAQIPRITFADHLFSPIIPYISSLLIFSLFSFFILNVASLSRCPQNFHFINKSPQCNAKSPQCNAIKENLFYIVKGRF